MAITKLGAELFGLYKSTGIGGMLFPAMTAFTAANDIASGQSSLGGSLGETAGSFVGWHYGDKAMRALTRNANGSLVRKNPTRQKLLALRANGPASKTSPFWRGLGRRARVIGAGLLNFGGMLGPMAGGLAGETVGGAVLP